jgi:hypothetical protein
VSTRYVSGTKGRAFRRKHGKRFVKISLRELRTDMACEVDQALYRERMSQEA